MSEKTARPSYWAVIPADVRYDDQIPANAKLLYGEISALCDRTGYCWAKNEYFAQLFGFAEVTVSRLVSAEGRLSGGGDGAHGDGDRAADLCRDLGGGSYQK